MKILLEHGANINAKDENGKLLRKKSQFYDLKNNQNQITVKVKPKISTNYNNNRHQQDEIQHLTILII